MDVESDDVLPSEPLPVIPEDSAEWLADSIPASPLLVLPRASLKRCGDATPESASSTSTARSSVQSSHSYEQFERLADRIVERESEYAGKQSCSCACTTF